MTDGGMERTATSGHLPVMYRQVLEGLQVRGDGAYLDGTFGRGGHARGVLDQLGPGGRLLLMDKDPDAIAVAEREFGTDPRVAIFRGSFADLARWDATAAGLDGVLFDLGVSSPQLDVAERGFSFGKDGPLDMRMDPDSGQSAAEWLATAEDREIADVLWTYGEERQSRRIARAIVARRDEQPLTRTAQLAELIASVMPRGKDKIHPATRSFQAIRIFINRHAKAPPANRRMPVEVEFTPVLQAIGGAQKAGDDETAGNPRARSAVLRVAEKLPSLPEAA